MYLPASNQDAEFVITHFKATATQNHFTHKHRLYIPYSGCKPGYWSCGTNQRGVCCATEFAATIFSTTRGVFPKMIYTERLRPRGVPFLFFEYTKGKSKGKEISLTYLKEPLIKVFQLNLLNATYNWLRDFLLSGVIIKVVYVTINTCSSRSILPPTLH